MQQSLPLVQDKHAYVTPTADAIGKISQLAQTNVETAAYFARKFSQVMDVVIKAETDPKKTAAFKNLVAAVNQLPDDVRLQEKQRANIYEGETPATPLATFQANKLEAAAVAKSTEALPELPSDNKLVLFGYTLDSKANFAALGAVDDKPFELTGYFNQWLGQHGYVNTGVDPEQAKQGVNTAAIMQATDTGQIKTNATGEGLRADPEELRTLIEHETQGFAGFIQDIAQKQDKAVQVYTHCFSDEELEQMDQLAAQQSTSEAPEAPAAEGPSTAPSSTAAEASTDAEQPDAASGMSTGGHH